MQVQLTIKGSDLKNLMRLQEILIHDPIFQNYETEVRRLDMDIETEHFAPDCPECMHNMLNHEYWKGGCTVRSCKCKSVQTSFRGCSKWKRA